MEKQIINEATPRPTPVLGGNTSTGILKIIALVFMFIDHSGKMLFQNDVTLRVLGRIAFPIYCWCLVVGFCYTRSPLKYLLRILLVGVISQPLYMIALNHTWKDLNIFWTLFLALAALWGIRERWYLSHIWAPLLAILIAIETNANYGWRGVVLVLMLYAAREKRGAIAAVMVGMSLAWAGTSSAVRSLFGIDLSWLHNWRYQTITSAFMRMQTLMLLSLPFILWPMKKNVKMPIWLSYALYPLHLALLWGLEQIV
ncbi:MAG: hypothetical protein IKP40_01480 [Clostridia bacterium]|nr:hypothetical protein [Clostridia bacterium]